MNTEYQTPQKTIKLDLVRISLWSAPDESDIEYYELSARLVEQLNEFVQTGKASPEIRRDLEVALQSFPLWNELSMEDTLHREQRESVAGRFVETHGHKVAIEYDLELDVTLY